MKTKLLLFLISILFSLTIYSEKKTYEETSVYKKERIEGFTVMINPEAAKHPEELKKAKREVESQVKKIKQAVPSSVYRKLKKVKIWVHWKSGNGAAAYHPSEVWLKGNGHNPDKAKGIEITNINNFVNWSKNTQPWLLMHELAHAYHHQILGYGNEEIKTAYENAKKKRIYDAIKHVNGKTQKAYAITNEKEYFSELTEAYFGKNDMYPFNAKELEEHDPEAYKLLKKLWKGK